MSESQTEAILRKIIRGNRDGWGHMYVDADSNSICLDGWTDNLTDDELIVFRQIIKEERDV